MKAKSCLPCIIAGATGAIVASLIPLFVSLGKAETKLLPFQGRLTDAAGNAVGDGAKVVEFKMYDAPTGGNVKWAGEVHKLSINGGLVNTMLGSKASLGSVDFSSATFLQITLDANSDGQITAADPPLLPRQNVVPAVYAAVAGELQYGAGGNYGAVKGGDIIDSSGKLKASAIAANDGIAANQLAANSVTENEIKDEEVTLTKLAPEVLQAFAGVGTVTSGKILDGDVQEADLAGRDVPTVVPGAVTSEKIRDGTILARDIAAESLTPDRMIRDIAVFSDTKDAFIHGGSAIAGWQLRVLNKEDAKPLGANSAITLANNTITLLPGVYRVSGSCPAHDVLNHQTVIRDVTGSPLTPVIAVRGTSDYCEHYDPSGAGASAVTNRSFFNGVLTVNGSNRQYQIWHYCRTANPDNGLGTVQTSGASAPQQNVFSQITIERIK